MLTGASHAYAYTFRQLAPAQRAAVASGRAKLSGFWQRRPR
jgi:hypothetical protein